MDILIGGDVAPINRNLLPFRSGNAEGIFNDLLVEFEKADFAIVNLESPLIDKETPISKTGRVLGVVSSCINGFKQAKISALGLANNHIMDHGPTGLKNTLAVCEQAGILTVGAGENLRKARQMLIQRVGGIRVGFMAVAEHEFGIATLDSWGSNPLDPIAYVRDVKAEKGSFDYLIVLLHGGNEGYPFPSPRLMNICRFLVEEGANAVICQHSHVAGCYEEYQGGHIVYGQGNLIFDLQDRGGSWHEGFLVRLSIAENLRATMEVIPYLQSRGGAGARRMSGKEDLVFRNTLDHRSLMLRDSNYIRESWLRFCAEKRNGYLSRVLGHNRLLTRLNRYGKVVQYLYTRRSMRSLHNVVRCESHRDVLLEILDEYSRR